MSEPDVSCQDVEAAAAEAALGTLAGAERAAVLSHLSGCSRCRDLVDQLAPVADSLLLLAPPAEPPAGFESRVLNRIGSAARPEPAPSPAAWRRRPRRGLVAVAAVALVAAMAGASLALLTGPGRTQGDLRTALTRDHQGRWTCRAVAYGSKPTWLVVSLDRRDGASWAFSVEVHRKGEDAPVRAGELRLEHGHGSLTTQLDIPAPELHSVRVLDATGQVRYQMEFRSSA